MPITMFNAGLAQTTLGVANPPGPVGTGILTEGGDVITTEGGIGIALEGADIRVEDTPIPDWLRLPSRPWKALLPVLLLLFSAQAFGQAKISDMPAASTPLGGDELTVVVQPGSCRNSSTCNKQTTISTIWNGAAIPDNVRTLPYTVASADLNGLIVLTGSGNLTFGAGTITPGKFLCYTNANPIGGGNNATIVGTITGLPNTTVYPGGGGCVVARTGTGTYDWSPGVPGGDVGLLSILQAWTKPQRSSKQTPAISGNAFTPDFGAAQSFEIDLVHASCPCQINNPTNLPPAGQVQDGMIEIKQSSTGSDLISIWGPAYSYVGSTGIITLSTGASVVDYIPYHISDGVHVILGGIVKGPTH